MTTSLSRAFGKSLSEGAAASAAIPECELPEERLSFTVERVRNKEALQKAVYIRHAAYARHVPTLAEKLRSAEAEDDQLDTAVFLAESRLDGSPLGTLRVQSNTYRPLPVEQSVELPGWIRDRRLVEISRLGVVNGTMGRVVKAALMKAAYRYCVHHDIEWVIAAGRAPVDRQYDGMLFDDLFPERGFISMRHAGDIPHRVMSLGIPTLRERWKTSNHPLAGFFFDTYHPDIDISAGTAPSSENLRASISPTEPARSAETQEVGQ